MLRGPLFLGRGVVLSCERFDPAFACAGPALEFRNRRFGKANRRGCSISHVLGIKDDLHIYIYICICICICICIYTYQKSGMYTYRWVDGYVCHHRRGVCVCIYIYTLPPRRKPLLLDDQENIEETWFQAEMAPDLLFSLFRLSGRLVSCLLPKGAKKAQIAINTREFLGDGGVGQGVCHN